MWGAIKKALNSTVGTSDFKPLDELIEYQTNVKVQRVTFTISGGTSGYKDKEISSVPTSKSIIIPTGYVYDSDLNSLTFSFSGSSTVRCTYALSGALSTTINITVMVITFGSVV